jgi:hypothetical protein
LLTRFPTRWKFACTLVTLAALTKLTEEQYKRGIETGVINPKMQRKDVKALRV